MVDGLDETRRQLLKASALAGYAVMGFGAAGVAQAGAAETAGRMAPRPEFVFRARVKLGTPQEIGQAGNGYRRIVPITGGTFAGPELNGTILPFGADWQLISPAGQLGLDARYTLQTDRDEFVYVNNVGHISMPPSMIPDLVANRPIDWSQTHAMGACRMESGAERLRWMNDHIFIPRSGPDEGDDVLAIDFYRLVR